MDGPNIPVTEIYRQELSEIFQYKRFVVFLCGPSLSDLSKPGAKLRKQIKESLEKEGFEVVLGEDDGLEDLQRMFGLDAQQNEMQFVERHCNAIVLIASSVGAYCELGLFSYYKANFDNELDFILLVSNKYEGKRSYLNLGPAAIVDSFGRVFYSDFKAFDVAQIIERLRIRRSVYFKDARGRPPSKEK